MPMPENKKTFRVAILGIYHESNTFLGSLTQLEHFRQGHWLQGQALCQEYQHAFHEIGGMMEGLQQAGATVVPVMFAEAIPGGRLSGEAYATLSREMMAQLDQVLPVDACLVVVHGAAVSEQHPDMDGHWLAALRQKLGPKVPIVGTLDPHANVSPLMVASTDALVAYRTNPHIDQRETGSKAAALLLGLLQEEYKPVQVLTQLPLAISIEQQNTSEEPCKSLCQLAESFSQEPGVLSVSLMLGFPYADVAEMGSSFIVVTDQDPEQARQIGKVLQQAVLAQAGRFVGKKKCWRQQLQQVAASPRPVLLLDMGDNVGGGSPGDSTCLLEALEGEGRYRSLVCLHDPGAVAYASQFQAGERFPLAFGRHPEGRHPFEATVTLLWVQEGRFDEAQPRHGGQVHYNMGTIALVLTPKGSTVLLMSRRIPPFSLRQITAFGIEPAAFDVIVAKGVNAPIAAYGPVCPAMLQVHTPGLTQADMTRFEYRNRRKPLFPFETLTLP